ncbi:uncharacterized protein LOC122396568 [Colletes gigas]|uniref:uncharacterized protein LOC122396568 n=1 Tax=Colletes gigas TaxID=935657 RepID=UPI001C9B3BA4|nr:uncharacterized protein LOC122396568 [Colletes gigas]
MLFATGLNGTGSKQTISIKATYIYPRYEAYSILPDRSHNIALLKLIKPFDTCNKKIILPNVISVSYDNNYTTCLIFGWQSYVSPSSKVFAKPILYSEVILNSWKLCTYMLKTNVNYTNVFCTMVEFKDEIKACAGNPGSPVICENQYHEIAVVGIASWTNFSLECGDLPTYLDLGAFRMWLHNLIFSNKETENKEGNKKASGKNYKFSSQNNTNLLQINYWSEDISIESTNKSRFWNKLYLPILDDFNNTNISFSHGYHDIPYTNILKEPSNNIYRYEEIGRTKNLENDNYIVDGSNKHERLGYQNKSLLCGSKNFDQAITEINKDESTELNHFEFLLPFNYEDITASYSSVITYSKNEFFLFYILLFLWYYYLHIMFYL